MLAFHNVKLIKSKKEMMSCSHALTIERESTQENQNEENQSTFFPTLAELKYGVLYFAGLCVLLTYISYLYKIFVNFFLFYLLKMKLEF